MKRGLLLAAWLSLAAFTAWAAVLFARDLWWQFFGKEMW